MATHLPGECHGQRSPAGYIVHGVTRVGHDLVTKPPPPYFNKNKLKNKYATKWTL